MKLMLVILLLVQVDLIPSSCNSPVHKSVDVLIIGGGASGTMARIWLGGMLTSAGVCAIDRNHRITMVAAILLKPGGQAMYSMNLQLVQKYYGNWYTLSKILKYKSR